MPTLRGTVVGSSADGVTIAVREVWGRRFRDLEGQTTPVRVTDSTSITWFVQQGAEMPPTHAIPAGSPVTAGVESEGNNLRAAEMSITIIR